MPVSRPESARLDDGFLSAQGDLEAGAMLTRRPSNMERLLERAWLADFVLQQADCVRLEQSMQDLLVSIAAAEAASQVAAVELLNRDLDRVRLERRKALRRYYKTSRLRKSFIKTAEDWLLAPARWIVLWWNESNDGRAMTDDEIADVEKQVNTVAQVLAVLMAIFMLAVPIAIFSLGNLSPGASVFLVLFCIALFAVAIAFLVRLERIQLFAAVATYAAVLVSFSHFTKSKDG